MSPPEPDTLAAGARRLALAAALVVAAIGAATLVGWITGITVASRLWPAAATTKANTALCLVALGPALLADLRPPRRPWLAAAAHVAGALAAALALLTAVEWTFGVGLGIDELLVTDPTAGPAPGRMAPLTCAMLLLVALARSLDRRPAVDGRVVSGLGLAVTVVGLVGIVGYVGGLSAMTTMSGALRMSLPCAAAVACAGVAVLLTRPTRGGVRLLIATGSAGTLVRWLLPVAVVAPLAGHGLLVAAVEAGMLDQRVGDWLFTPIVLGAFAAVVVCLGRRIDQAERTRVAIEERLRRSESLARTVTESAYDAIVGADAGGVITLFNPGAERLFGWTADEVRGRSVTMLMPERYRRGHTAGLSRVAAGGPPMLGGKTIDLHGLTKSGREFDLELSLSPVHADGELHVTAIMRDISQRKLLEQLAREEADRMARVVRAQARIATGGGDLVETMQLVAAHSAAIIGGAGAVVELPDGDELVYRAAVGRVARHLGARLPIEGSLSGHCLRTGETLNCTDSETDDRVDRESCRRIGVRSMICVALKHQGVAVGVLKVQSEDANAFGEREERTLELLGALGAAAVHRAQVERRLAAHHVTGQALARGRSLETGLAGALQGIGEQLGWELGVVWLAEEEQGGELVCAETWADAAFPAAPYLELIGARDGGLGLASGAQADACPRWVEDAGTVHAHTPDPRRAAAAAACGLRTLVAVPIASRGEVVGVLELGAREARTHDTATLDLLASLAAQLGQFAERRRAEERTAVHAAHLAAVAELSQELSRSRDPRETRAALCRSVRDLTRSNQVVLMEPDGQGRLVITGQSGDLVDANLSIDIERDTALTVDVFLNGKGMFIGDVRTEPRAFDRLVDTGLLSAHLEPLKRDGTVLGVICVAADHVRSREAGGLGSLMRLLAAEAATALTLADLLVSLEDRARTDELTGLANRRTLDGELPRELARATRTGAPLTMAILDLDHFKTYNDTFGHPAGDRLLRAAALAWAERLRATDLLARYGGEEFVVLLPNCDAWAAAKVAEALRSAVPDGATCSIGVATSDGSESPDELVARADAALYRAKDAGRDRVVSDTLRARAA